MSLYRSIYAVLSPAQLTKYLEHKLANEVELHHLEIKDVDFHFFHRFFFRPTIQWQGLNVSYTKNCNYIKVVSPSLFVELDLSSVLQKKLQITRIDGSELDLKIIRNKACDSLSSSEQSILPEKKATRVVHQSKANQAEVSYVKNLPDFSFTKVKLQTEKNKDRYYVFHHLKVRKSKDYFSFDANVEFSPATKLAFLPSLKLKGRFDENQNIVLSTKIREADLQIQVEALGEKNYRTKINLRDFPFRYAVKAIFYDYLKEPQELSTHWIDLSAYTIGHWDDFFDKRIPIQIESLKLRGNAINLAAEDITYHLKKESVLNDAKINVTKLNIEELSKFFESHKISKDSPFKGLWQGELAIKGQDISWQGGWKNLVWSLPAFKSILMIYDSASSSGYLMQDSFKERIEDIHTKGKKAEGYHELSSQKSLKSLQSKVHLKGLPHSLFNTYKFSSDVRLDYSNLDNKNLRMQWSDIKEDNLGIAKVVYSEKQTDSFVTKEWQLYNLQFKNENSFLTALSNIDSKIKKTKAINKAFRLAKYSTNGDQRSDSWTIDLLNPKRRIFLQKNSATDWQVFNSKKQNQGDTIVFQEDVFSFIK